ncbi:MAG TPA: hypothetical protein GX404_08055 [Syntrophomonadaceae bacterium]|nr:hypothetical protein [Syntrophomonadaceae bacterium]
MKEHNPNYDDLEQNIQSAQQATRLAQNTYHLLARATASGNPTEIACAQQRLQDALGQILQTQDYVSQWLSNEQMQELNHAAAMLQTLYRQVNDANLERDDYTLQD